jgi:5,10-methenyltetrahydromethanopterin hydrogenase
VPAPASSRLDPSAAPALVDAGCLALPDAAEATSIVSAAASMLRRMTAALLRMASSLVRQAGLNARWLTSCRRAPSLRAAAAGINL